MLAEDFPPIDRAYIAAEDAAGRFLGTNPEAGRMIDLLAHAGAFDGARTTKAIEQQIYAFSPSQPQVALREPSGTSYGFYRLDNLRHGRTGFTRREADFFHRGFRRVFGDAWAAAISPETLALRPIQETLRRCLALGVPWSSPKLSPFAVMEALPLAQTAQGLSIRPAAPGGKRLGGPAQGPNAALRSSRPLPEFRPDDPYVLHVNGAVPDQDALFVFEVSNRDLAFEGDDQGYCGFPIARLTAQTPNTSLSAAGDEPFRVYAAAGVFAFCAAALPIEIAERIAFDPSAERLTRSALSALLQALHIAQTEAPNAVRFARFAYQVR